MVEKDTILKEQIWYVGIANFKDYYEYAYDWLIGEDYVITEDKYKEVQRGDSKDLEILWKANKKITDYFRIALELKWKILGMEDIEIEIDGKKEKNAENVRMQNNDKRHPRKRLLQQMGGKGPTQVPKRSISQVHNP